MLLCDSKKIASITNGKCSVKTSFTGIYTDTREDGNNKLFVALKGKNFDGHDFIEAAEKNNAKAVLVHKKVNSKLTQIIVEDTSKAYAKIASWHRKKLSPIVIAITGSNGKTSVKNMLASILNLHAKTISTKENFNNHLGVPKTLLGINKMHKYCVIEMGANGVNEIANLCSIAKPDLAIITNANNAHLGGFGSVENLVRTKAQIFASLPANGTAFFHAKSKHKKVWQEIIGIRELILFGEGSNTFASNIKEKYASLEFTLHCNNDNAFIKMNMIGLHQVENALAASACAAKLGVDIKTIKKGLQLTSLEKNRLSILDCKDFIVLDDSYNASPYSMKAAIKTLSKRQGEKVAVLGSMAELGEKSKEFHIEIGNYLKKHSITNVYTLGLDAKNYHGKKHFQDINSIFKTLHDKHKGATILIKGSRIINLDKLVKLCKKK